MIIIAMATELVDAHFVNLTGGNLYYDEASNRYDMFSGKGTPFHLNYLTFKALFAQLNEQKDVTLLETGIASAGTQSTYLFDAYIRKYGGRFWSVDTNRDLVDTNHGNMCPGTTLVCNDSVAFLNEWVASHPDTKADAVYLDSWDLDWYHSEPAASHGLREYHAVLPALSTGSLLLIDDTPATPYWLDNRGGLYTDMVKFYEANHFMPGKGQYVIDEVKLVSDQRPKVDMLMHNYQVLYKFM